MVVNKWLIGALIVTTLATGGAPAYANTGQNVDYNPTQVTKNYTVSIDDIRIELEGKVETAELLMVKNQFSRKLFVEMATLINQLETAVKESNKPVSEAIKDVINRADKLVFGINNVAEAVSVQDALKTAKVTFGMSSVVVSTDTSAQKPATNVVKLSDISNHWGKSFIERLVSIGAIKGFPDGTFRPDATISRAEFLAIAMNATTKDVASYPKKIDHWASSILEAAYANNVVKSSEIAHTAEALNKPITRQEMAMVMIRVNLNIQNEDKASTLGANTLIADYNKVPEYYKEFVAQAYMKGFIGGVDKQGTFAGDKLGTRAQAATMLVRLLDDLYRTPPKIDASKSIIAPARAPITIREGETNRKLLPQAGDTFIKKDGTKVVITSKVFGGYEIVGYGQGLDLYTGMEYAEGLFGHGKIGGMWEDSLRYAGEPYLICKKTGEGHFSGDWIKISSMLQEEAHAAIKNPKDQQTFGNWLRYHSDIGGWGWEGPIAH